MEAEVVALGKEIERMERREAMDAELSRPVSSPLTTAPGKGEGAKSGRASDEYRSAMLSALRSNFRHVSNVLVEGTDASGGYLVPAEWDARLIEKLDEENVIRRLGTTIQTSGERKINVAATKPAASWVEESGALQFSDPAFSQVILDAYKLSVAVKVSEELLADNQYDLEGYLIRSFGQAIAQKEEEAFIIGDGNKKPAGILHATYGGQTGITAAKEAELSVDEVIDLIYKLKRPYRAKAAFLMADSTLASIRKMKDGTGQYIWQPALTAGEPDRLLGYPVYTSAYMPTIAAGQPVAAFGDYSYKSHKSKKTTEDEWLITKNTQAAIVDEETWQTVHKMRESGRRRKQNVWDKGPLNGFLYCPDCGCKLYFSHPGKLKTSGVYMCGYYLHYKKFSSHYTRRDELEPAVLAQLKADCAFAREHEDEFIKLVEKKTRQHDDDAARKAEKDYAEAKARIGEIDRIINQLYEDKVSGDLSPERFSSMLSTYETEQGELRNRCSELQAQITAARETSDNAKQFVKIVRKFTEMQELTPEIVATLIERIEVGQAQEVDGV
ncbi:MAG: phage major capsid protein, partial [Clostridia bacterium]|nr:phage major capsid protein [Clostridia bacterium]